MYAGMTAATARTTAWWLVLPLTVMMTVTVMALAMMAPRGPTQQRIGEKLLG
jgi:ABC-type dipeptide/oligopeptide/nickel transport system permease subunit